MVLGQGESWLLDEIAHAGPEHLDPGYVAGYDLKAGTDPGPDIGLLRDMGLGQDSVLVDMGCGTGRLALAAAPLCRRVVAVDVSAEMLDAVRSGAAVLDGPTRPQCVKAGFLTYEHSGDPADFVYSRNALHHLPDFWKAVALRRVAALLVPGGVLRLRDLVFSFAPIEVEERISAWLDSAADEPVDGWTRDELETHLREEYSTFTWLLEPMLERSGFDILEASYSDSGVYAAYTCARV